MKIIYTVIMAAVIFSGLQLVSVSAMSSQNYRIQSDSVNIGGVKEGSGTYFMDETTGEVGTGESSSASYKLSAGYQAMQEVYLSISSPVDVTMGPAIGVVTGGTGNGSASWTIVTDDPAGYILSIKASVSPAMQSGAYSFADYAPAGGGTPDFNWSIINSDSRFGFTPEGASIIQKFKDNGISCNTGSGDTADKCWYNLSTSDETIANSPFSNQPAGEATVVKFRAQSGSAHLQVAGTYTATIMVTAVAN